MGESNAVADKQEILEVLYRYSIVIDADELERLDSVFTPDAVWELKYGEGARVDGVDAIRDILTGFHEKLDATQHLVANAVIDVSGDEARSRSDVRVMLFSAAQPPGERRYEAGAVYTDNFQRTTAGWRMSKRCIDVRWTDGNSSLSS